MASKDLDSLPKQCTCMQGNLTALPPELWPRSHKKSGLRKTTCPGCGMVYRTNRATDLCMECEHRETVVR